MAGIVEWVASLIPKPKKKKRVVPVARGANRDIRKSVDFEGMDPAMIATIKGEQERQSSARYLTEPAGNLTKKGKKK